MSTNMRNLTTVDAVEMRRLLDCEKAWRMCYELLEKGNPAAFRRPTPGPDCAREEIQRLQSLERKVNEETPKDDWAESRECCFYSLSPLPPVYIDLLSLPPEHRKFIEAQIEAQIKGGLK